MSYCKTHLVLAARSIIICRVQVVLAITPSIIAPLWCRIRVTALLIRSLSLRMLKSYYLNQDRGGSGMLKVFNVIKKKSKNLCINFWKRSSSKQRRDKNNRECSLILTNQSTVIKCVSLKSSRNDNNKGRNPDKRSSIWKMRHQLRSIALSRSTKNKSKRQVMSRFWGRNQKQAFLNKMNRLGYPRQLSKKLVRDFQMLSPYFRRLYKKIRSKWCRKRHLSWRRKEDLSKCHRSEAVQHL